MSWQKQATFQWDGDNVCFVQDQHTKLDFYRIVLSHWNNRPRDEMSLQSDTLSWLPTNQPSEPTNQSLYLLLNLNTVFLVEKQQIPILPSVSWLDQGSNLLSYLCHICGSLFCFVPGDLCRYQEGNWVHIYWFKTATLCLSKTRT